MTNKKKVVWERTASGRLSRSLPCSSRILIDANGAGDLCLPSGRHRHGQAASVEQAKSDSMEAYGEYAMGRWMEGHTVAGGAFKTTL